MQTEFTLTVREATMRPSFLKARIVAGKNGLGRKIRWVHILEVSDFDTLIHGGEMILTTGVGLHWGEPSQTSFLKKLIDKGVSCLCIEIGSYFHSISEELIQLADQHDFPLIVFNETVRFVDITQDLHPLIINQHYKMLEHFEKISREFNRLALTSQGHTQILKLLSTSINAQVIVLPTKGNTEFYPLVSTDRQQKLTSYLQSKLHLPSSQNRNDTPVQWGENSKRYLVQPIGAMKQTWAQLILIVDERSVEEFDTLILDRAALALSQDYLRKRYIEERKLHKEHVWMDDLIHQRMDNEDQIKSLLGFPFREKKHIVYRVCVIQLNQEEHTEFEASKTDEESTLLHIALLVRSTFENYAFHPFLTTKNNKLIVLVVDLKENKLDKEQLKKVTQSLRTMFNKQSEKFKLEIGFGHTYSTFLEAHKSYQEAKSMLRINDLPLPSTFHFYEDMGVYRLLLHPENDKTLQLYIDDYLKPLIEHDQIKGSQLLLTMKKYIELQFSKKLTADKLFITRQTLYHRLSTIEELLGEDYLSSDRRLAIEIALCAYQMLYPNK